MPIEYNNVKNVTPDINQSINQSEFLPARGYANAGNGDRNVSVRLSVCPSVTRRYCVKTK